MLDKGFSFLELLVAISIMAVLALYAYPNYIDHIVRVRRIEGQTALLDLANRMEQFYAIQKTYQNATLGTGNASDILPGALSANGWYRLAIVQQTTTTFLLHAIARGNQAVQDKQCPLLTLNSAGNKGVGKAFSTGKKRESLTSCWK